MEYNIERARRAVEYLVNTPYFPHRVRGLRGNVKKPRALPYKDEEEVLNELLVIGRQSLQAMENLIAMAEYKRDVDRVGYQRQYMADMRRRQRKAAQLEERRIGRKMNLDERVAFAHEVQGVWMEERDAYILKRVAQFKTQYQEEPTFDDKRAFIDQFWEIKEKELDAMLAEPVAPATNLFRKRKRVVQVSEPDTAMSAALKKLIDNPKK
jgi:hypothetical protein